MALVNKQHRPGLLARLFQFEQRRDLPVHREDAVGGNNNMPRPRRFRLFELLPQIGDAGVLEAVASCFTEPHAIDDARVIELVGDDGVLRRQNRLKQSRVGVEARRIKDGRLGAVELRDPFFERLVRGLRAADEAHRRQAEPELVERFPGRRDESRVVGKAQIVVRAKVEDCAVAACSVCTADGDPGPLGRGHDGLGLEGAG